jgi:KaiC/GvpD/RAD55 family RecA-like ATPase
MPKKLKMKDLLIGENTISVVVADAHNYLEEISSVIKELTGKAGIPGVYITINKPYHTITKQFEKAGINNKMMIFIDAISAQSGKLEKEPGCLYIQTPKSLSDLSIAIGEAVKALPSDRKFIFFDSLTTLLIYNEAHSVLRFAHFITNKMRSWDVDGVILSLDSDTKSSVFQQIVLFADNIVNLSKGGK